VPELNTDRTTVEEMADGEADAKLDQMPGDHDPESDDNGVSYTDG
jgi:hypothetical protein